MATMACNLLTLFATLPAMEQAVAADPALAQGGVTFIAVFGLLVISFGVALFSWWLVMRWRSAVGKWLVTLMAIVPAMNMLGQLATAQALPTDGDIFL